MNNELQSERAMISKPAGTGITYAFIGCPFFKPKMVTHPGSGQSLEVALEPGGDVPIVLNCHDSKIRPQLEERLKSLGYDVHTSERLKSLKESTKLLSDANISDSEEKFQQIKQSYVYAIIEVQNLSD